MYSTGVSSSFLVRFPLNLNTKYPAITHPTSAVATAIPSGPFAHNAVNIEVKNVTIKLDNVHPYRAKPQPLLVPEPVK